MLSAEQRRLLLRIARQSIEAALAGRQPDVDPGSLDDVLRRPSGAFVTLSSRSGDLRGCIGTIEPVAPLWEAVRDNALNAAFRDPRFPPLAPVELPELELEISVMGPVEPVADVGEIEVGRDGLIVRYAGNAGLLLPQVAVEWGWDREEFLRHTCRKAGLPMDAWRDPRCRIEKFSAEVFGEQTTHSK